MTHALALAHAATHQPFNADFYTVAATVIPVLFLAIAVQGTTLDTISKLSGALALLAADISENEKNALRRRLNITGRITLSTALFESPRRVRRLDLLGECPAWDELRRTTRVT